MTELTCPKCLSSMRTIDRNGIVIERCDSCGGVFLDRGELDQLIRAENAFLARDRQVPAGRWGADQEWDRDDDDDDARKRDDDDLWERDNDQRRGRRRKRRGFLEDIFG